MLKLVLLGASWCPVTKETKELFDGLKKEDFNFDYEYIDISSEKGKLLVNNFSVTDIPKTIFQDKIIFHGLPSKEKTLEFIKNSSM